MHTSAIFSSDNGAQAPLYGSSPLREKDPNSQDQEYQEKVKEIISKADALKDPFAESMYLIYTLFPTMFAAYDKRLSDFAGQIQNCASWQDEMNRVGELLQKSITWNTTDPEAQKEALELANDMQSFQEQIKEAAKAGLVDEEMEAKIAEYGKAFEGISLTDGKAAADYLHSIWVGSSDKLVQLGQLMQSMQGSDALFDREAGDLQQELDWLSSHEDLSPVKGGRPNPLAALAAQISHSIQDLTLLKQQNGSLQALYKQIEGGDRSSATVASFRNALTQISAIRADFLLTFPSENVVNRAFGEKTTPSELLYLVQKSVYDYTGLLPWSNAVDGALALFPADGSNPFSNPDPEKASPIEDALRGITTVLSTLSNVDQAEVNFTSDQEQKDMSFFKDFCSAQVKVIEAILAAMRSN